MARRDLAGDVGVDLRVGCVRLLDLVLIGSLKASPDWATARALMDASPVQAAWSAHMADLIEWDVDDDGNLPLLREVFRHD